LRGLSSKGFWARVRRFTYCRREIVHGESAMSAREPTDCILKGFTGTGRAVFLARPVPVPTLQQARLCQQVRAAAVATGAPARQQAVAAPWQRRIRRGRKNPRKSRGHAGSCP
jgi:hypothetical protein